jgi:hypothetical protein
MSDREVMGAMAATLIKQKAELATLRARLEEAERKAGFRDVRVYKDLAETRLQLVAAIERAEKAERERDEARAMAESMRVERDAWRKTAQSTQETAVARMRDRDALRAQLQAVREQLREIAANHTHADGHCAKPATDDVPCWVVERLRALGAASDTKGDRT